MISDCVKWMARLNLLKVRAEVKRHGIHPCNGHTICRLFANNLRYFQCQLCNLEYQHLWLVHVLRWPWELHNHENYTISVISRHHGTSRQRNGVWKRADVIFRCSDPPSTPLIWSRKSGKILFTGNTVFSSNCSNSNVEITINPYTLTVTNVQSAVDAQTYTCVVIAGPDEHSADLVLIGK